MQQAIGYVRVSTEGQAQDGVSLDAQTARISAWCQANGYSLLSIEQDAGISGGRADNRPGLQRALTQASKHKAALVVYSLSRMSRSIKDTLSISEQLNKAGADLVSLSERIDTTSASGRMVFAMLTVLNQFEREQIGERTAAALAHLRQQGRRISGKVPYGFSLDGDSLVPNHIEQEAITLMQRLRLAGLSLRRIAAELTRRGVVSKSGAAWSATVIRSILQRVAA